MTITAIIPCYNAEPYLAEAVESVLRQTRPADEIIVVDDCSTDNSEDVARRYPVRLLSTERNAGHATARNIGMEAAGGEIIAWLDADDCWGANHIETVAGLLERYPEAAVAFSAVKMFGTKERTISSFPCSEGPRNIFRESLRKTVVPAMSAVTRKRALTEAGGYDGRIRIAPDYDLWLRMSRRHLFVSTEEITSYYRRHEGQITSRSRLRQVRSVYEARFRMYLRVLEEGNRAEAAEVKELMLEIRDEDLKGAWWSRDMGRLRFLLRLSEYVPGETDVSRTMRRRRYLPKWWLASRDGARAVLQKVKSAGAAGGQRSKAVQGD